LTFSNKNYDFILDTSKILILTDIKLIIKTFLSKEKISKMGVVIAVIAIAGAIGNYIAGNVVQDLKDQVQAIIDLHKPDMDNVTKLKELLEKLDMKNLN